MTVISIVLGSVRPGRQGARLGKFLENTLAQRKITYHVIDPMPLNLPVMFSRYDWIKNSPDCPKGLHEVAKKLNESDGFIIVAPEYNHTVPPALCNILNYFYHDEFYYKPAGIVTYSMGSFGGARAAVALRPFLGELGLVTIPQMMPVPTISKLLDENGNSTGAFPKLQENTDSFVDELLWYSQSLESARSKGLPK